MARNSSSIIDSEANKSLWRNRDISSFLNEEYRDYSLYCAMERACPSLIDGFKITQRKIMHSAFKGACKNGQLVKLLNLTGDTLKETLYAHGDGSLNGGIIGLGQSFSDNLNPLFIEGQAGTLRDQTSVSAPRYLYVKLNKYAELYKTDYDLLKFLDEEGQSVEPSHYLPIIPTVLTRQNIGLAPGYRFSTMSYNPLDLIDACSAVVRGKSFKMPRPYINGIKQSNWRYVLPAEGSGYWTNSGEWEYNFSRDKMTVKDLPYDMGFDDFEKLLNKFLENGFIKDWSNYSEGEKINYEIFFEKGKLRKEAGKLDIHLPNKFKLIKKVPDDQLYVLDENNKVRHFKTPTELIEYFASYRLSIYNDRKTKMLKVLGERLASNSEMCKFIDLIIKGKLKVNNRPKAEIKADMKGYGLSESLISTPISKLTKEEYEALLKENEEIKKQIEYITKTSIEDMYLNDLKELRKSLEKDFPTEPNDTDKVKRESADSPAEKPAVKESEEPSKPKRRTKEEVAKEKAKKEKEKAKKEREKAKKEKEKIQKQKEREKAKKEKEKLQKQKEKEKKAKMKAKNSK